MTNLATINPFEDKSLPPIAENQLPADSSWLFPEYLFQEMNLDEYASVIIERILEKGSWAQLRWLFVTYGEPELTEWVRQSGFRLLSKRSFALWRIVFDLQDDYFAPDWARAGKEIGPW